MYIQLAATLKPRDVCINSMVIYMRSGPGTSYAERSRIRLHETLKVLSGGDPATCQARDCILTRHLHRDKLRVDSDCNWHDLLIVLNN